MTIYTVTVIAILALAAVVIFHEWVETKNRFEESAHRKEIIELFLLGFTSGLDSEGKNIDIMLKRLGYNGPEMTQEILTQKADSDIPVPADEVFVPEHEKLFDLELLNGAEGAQWADKEQGLFPMLDLDPGLQGPKE